MDDASFAKLHSKVYLKGFTTGSIIYERDTPSDTAYIILHGSVSVRHFVSYLSLLLRKANVFTASCTISPHSRR